MLERLSSEKYGNLLQLADDDTFVTEQMSKVQGASVFVEGVFGKQDHYMGLYPSMSNYRVNGYLILHDEKFDAYLNSLPDEQCAEMLYVAMLKVPAMKPGSRWSASRPQQYLKRRASS